MLLFLLTGNTLTSPRGVWASSTTTAELWNCDQSEDCHPPHTHTQSNWRSRWPQMTSSWVVCTGCIQSTKSTKRLPCLSERNTSENWSILYFWNFPVNTFGLFLTVCDSINYQPDRFWNHLEQWYSTFAMLWPLNTDLHVVLTPNNKIIFVAT